MLATIFTEVVIPAVNLATASDEAGGSTMEARACCNCPSRRNTQRQWFLKAGFKVSRNIAGSHDSNLRMLLMRNLVKASGSMLPEENNLERNKLNMEGQKMRMAHFSIRLRICRYCRQADMLAVSPFVNRASSCKVCARSLSCRMLAISVTPNPWKPCSISSDILII